MRKPNYSYEKRQKDLAKQKKNEEKRLRKLDRTAPASEDAPSVPAPSDSDVETPQS